IAGALHDYHVTVARIPALHLVLVVERGAADGHSADVHRLQFSDWRERPTPADADPDLFEARARLLRREFVRGRPARRPADHAEALLPVEAIDLVDHAVDFVRQLRTLILDLVVKGQHFFDALAQPGKRIDRKSKAAQPGQELPVGIGQRLADLASGIAKEAQWTLGRDSRIELTQAAGSGVARVGEDRLGGFGARLVHFQELGARHVYLAAHFDDLRHLPALELGRHVAHGAQIGCDVLTDLAVAARGALDELAVLITQRDRQPVDFGLGHQL